MIAILSTKKDTILISVSSKVRRSRHPTTWLLADQPHHAALRAPLDDVELFEEVKPEEPVDLETTRREAWHDVKIGDGLTGDAKIGESQS